MIRHRMKKHLIMLLFVLLSTMPFLQGLAMAGTDPVPDSSLQGLTIQYDESGLYPRFVQGTMAQSLSSDRDVLAYFERNKQLFGLTNPASELTMLRKDQDGNGKTHYLYQQHYNGIPVYGKYMRAHLDSSSRLYAITNKMAANMGLQSVNTTPALTAEQAIASLKAQVEGTLGSAITFGGTIGERTLTEPQAELVLYPIQNRYVLAYQVKIEYMQPTIGRWVGIVDAASGEVLNKYSNLQDAAATGSGQGYYGDSRTLNVYHNEEDHSYYMIDMSKPMFQEQFNFGTIMTYDYEKMFNGPVSSQTSVFTDSAAVDVHYFTGLVYDFYSNQFHRNSIDGNGMRIQSYVNVTPVFDNAFWDGNSMFYGIGDTAFGCLTCSLDIIAHEMTHGVTQHTAGLMYEGQSGALNESISDIMAAVLDADDWTIGEDADIWGAYALRDMQDPSKGLEPQPAHMRDYVNTEEDNGGVHTNSGIPNKAAYLIATGIDSVTGLSGQGRRLLGQIVYGALSYYLTPSSDFTDARDAFVLAAGDLDLQASQKAAVVEEVKDAWLQVGLPYTFNENHIVNFTVPSMAGPAYIDRTQHKIYFAVPYGTSLNGLIPTISVSPGASIFPISGRSQDFRSPVTYSVTSASGQSQDWLVQGYVGQPSSDNDIYEYYVHEATGPSIINHDENTITFYVSETANIAALHPYLYAHPAATYTPSEGTVVDFTNPVNYTVTAQDGSIRIWRVQAIKDSSSPVLEQVISPDSTTVRLSFSSPLTAETANDPTHYFIKANPHGDYEELTVPVLGAELQSDLQTVVLTTPNMQSEYQFRVTVDGVKGTNDRSVRPDMSVGYFITGDSDAPVLVQARAERKTVTLTFDEPLRVPGSIEEMNANFELTVNGRPMRDDSRQVVFRDRTITIPLSLPVDDLDLVEVAYSGSVIRDYAGHPAEEFEAIPIISRTTFHPQGQIGLITTDSLYKQIIKAPEGSVIYAIFHDNKKILRADLATGMTKVTTMANQPQRLYWHDNELYVAMIHQKHSPSRTEETQSGSIAILHASTMETTDEFNINLDPFDLVVDKNGYIYVSSGSGESTFIRSYSRESESSISEAEIRQASFLQYNNVLNRIYALTTDSSPRSMHAFLLNEEGVITGGYAAPVQGDSSLSANIRLSPDGLQLLNGAGMVFTAAEASADDMHLTGSILPFEDLSYSSDAHTFYTLTNGRSLKRFDSATLSLVSQVNLNQTATSLLAGSDQDHLILAGPTGNGKGTKIAYYASFGPNTPPPPSNPSDNSGGSSPTVPYIPPPVPVVPAASPSPAASPAAGKDGAVTLGGDAVTVTEKEIGGKQVIAVQPDPKKLKDALDQAKANAADKGGDKPPKIALAVEEMKDAAAIELPADIFTANEGGSSNVILSFQAGSATYELPLGLPSLRNALQQAGGSATDMKVTLLIEKPNEETRGKVDQAVKELGYSSVTESIGFTLSIQSNGKNVEVSDFGAIYVKRTLTLSKGLSFGEVTALVYDPVTGNTSFVPALTRTTDDGETVVDILSPHNSIYTVVQGTRTFADLNNHWARKDIELLASKTVVKGATDSTFNPEAAITRAEFTSLLVRALGLQTTSSDTSGFSDVSNKDWYAASVAAAVKAGLTGGYADGTFKPNATITRQEMAVLTARALEFPGKSSKSDRSKLEGYNDRAQMAEWAQDAISVLVDSGIMSGVEDARFAPSAPTTRAQATVILKRMMQSAGLINK